ncbi:MAG: cellulose binding domain-containing protein [Microbacterium sp.]
MARRAVPRAGELKGTKVGSGFAAAVVLENRGTTTLKPWTLSWTFGGTQKVKAVIGGSFVQTGAQVTVTAPRLLPKLLPGKKTALALTGSGAASVPWRFFLNGRACTS